MNMIRSARRILVAAGLAVASVAFAAGNREPEGAMMSARSAWRVEFTTLDDAKALAAESPTVLFFAADWCPTCKAAFRDLEANGAKLGDRKIVVVDYDTSAVLKKQYGVTYQHTWVWIDGSGVALQTWNGDGVDGILKRVKAM